MFSRSLVSVKEEMPRSYFFEERPGRMASKVTLVTSMVSPITWPSAAARSASMPMTVLPSGAMNSLGGYVASDATMTVPLLLIDPGTSEAIYATLAADEAAPDDELLDVPPPPLLPQATANIDTKPSAAPPRLRRRPARRTDIVRPPACIRAPRRYAIATAAASRGVGTSDEWRGLGRLHRELEQRVLHGVGQRRPRGLDDVR